MNNIFLSVNLIGRVKKKRNDVTEIVSELEIADVIFRRYDRKYVCCSQARFRQADFLLVEINNTKSMSPAMSPGEECRLLSRTAAGNRAYVIHEC